MKRVGIISGSWIAAVLFLVSMPLFAGQTSPGGCADPTGDGDVTAGDALYVLEGAVGIHACVHRSCDIDGSGRITAIDALSVLEIAVGVAGVAVNCPIGTTTVPTST